MTELDAILDDIRTNPADDLPRLALADWFMEQDDPVMRARGEFIHARCRAASLPVQDPERARLQKRALELRDRHQLEWLGGLAEHLESWDFERGMIIAGVSTQSLRRCPLSRLTAFASWRWVLGLRGTSLKNKELRGLFASAQLANITSLDLCDAEIAPAVVQALARSKHVCRLAALNLGYAQLGVEGLQALATSPYLGNIRILHLCNNSVFGEGVQAFVASTGFPQLERLDLSRNPIEDRGAVALAGAPHLMSLRSLSLSSCGIRDRGGIALATSSNLARLELLDLTDNPLREATREELRLRFGERLRLG